MTSFRKLALVTALAAALPLTYAASANAQDWMARVRVIGINPDAHSSVSGLDVDNQIVPELDFSYFINKNVAAELILGTARHKVSLNGASLGKLNHLPPTLTLQYHFTDLGAVKPYVGAGANLTLFYNVDMAEGLGVKKTSFGPALQAGLDYEIQKNVYLNLDVKKIWIATDVSAGGSFLTKLHIDPWVFGAGIGYRF